MLQSSLHRLLRRLLLLTLLVASPLSLASGDIEIRDAWIPEGPPVAAVLAGFMTIVNHGKEKVSIVTVSSPDFSTIEIHQTLTEGGMSRMRKLDKLTVYANDDVQLRPGGIHLMLIKPQRALHAGDSVTLTLRTDTDARIEISVPVKKAADDAMHHHHQH